MYIVYINCVLLVTRAICGACSASGLFVHADCWSVDGEFPLSSQFRHNLWPNLRFTRPADTRQWFTGLWPSTDFLYFPFASSRLWDLYCPSISHLTPRSPLPLLNRLLFYKPLSPLLPSPCLFCILSCWVMGDISGPLCFVGWRVIYRTCRCGAGDLWCSP